MAHKRTVVPENFEDLTPSQIWDGLRPKRQSGAESILLGTILQDAVECYLNRKGKLQWEADRWLFSPTDSCQAFRFSFNTICDYLEVDAEKLKARLLDMRSTEQRIKRIRHPHSRTSGVKYGAPRPKGVPTALRRDRVSSSSAGNTRNVPTTTSAFLIRAASTALGNASRKRVD